MGDFYDPEHPTELAWNLHQVDVLSTTQREEGSDAVAKGEKLSKPLLLKTVVPKGMSSSRFLPKGTKTKVNLEDQGRQKVSFSFSVVKKPLQNRFLRSMSPDKQPSEPLTPTLTAVTSFPEKAGQDLAERFTIDQHAHSQHKPKMDMGKMHFKKQFQNVKTKTELSLELDSAPIFTNSVLEQEASCEPEFKLDTEIRDTVLNNFPKECLPEDATECTTPSQEAFSDTSHIGKCEENMSSKKKSTFRTF